ncbi:MAG: NTP transferase domain-containing protein [Saprospiraceae bacterium]|nr:NTP transferase domain-containing protein [Bacteroidia bacterium]NNE14773.1 NTP transferase domain-containing protein [Saprospiraceae bacterium]NNL93202.1 NTP transferase domain-containing protein [Saprospiraceae bacterium]
MKPEGKHKKIAKVKINNFSRYDLSLLGFTSDFSKLSTDLSKLIVSNHNICIVDKINNKASGYISIIGSRGVHKVINPKTVHEHDFRIEAEKHDLAIINGDHFASYHGIIYCDSQTENVLKTKVQNIEHVSAIILGDVNKPFDWLSNALEQNLNDIPIIQAKQLPDHIETILKNNIPTLSGIVLAGGKSQRMGEDKSQMVYHELNQEKHLATLLSKCSITPYISKQYIEEKGGQFDIIPDSFMDLGPLGAICSCFLKLRNHALLVIACDLPLVNMDTIELLIKNRRPDKYATCLKSQNKDFPEPLIAIYEPKSFQRLMQFLSIGYSCPRKFLINTDVHIIEIDNDDYIMNVNTPEERKDALDKIKNANEQ